MEVTDKKRLKFKMLAYRIFRRPGRRMDLTLKRTMRSTIPSWCILFKQSVNEFYKEKAEWDKSEKLIQLEHIINSSIDSHPSKTRFPLLIKLIEEYVATRTADIMRRRHRAGSRIWTRQWVP